MVNKLDEFREIIHNSEKLKEALQLQAGHSNGFPAIQYNFNFFTSYCQNEQYVTLINQILRQILEQWHTHCLTRNLIDREVMKETWCKMLSQFFKRHGV